MVPSVGLRGCVDVEERHTPRFCVQLVIIVIVGLFVTVNYRKYRCFSSRNIAVRSVWQGACVVRFSTALSFRKFGLLSTA